MSEKIISFYKVREAYGEFSNFHPDYPFEYEGITYKTSEHFYQSKKFLNKEDEEDVINASSAKIAAEIGRSSLRQIRPDWEEIKIGVMKLAIGLKFGKYPNLQELLISTGNATIMEYSLIDSFWGSGPDRKGLNMLGNILMEYRDILNSERAIEMGG